MKKFEDLYNSIIEDKELKKNWEKAKEEQKKKRRIILIICLISIIVSFIIIQKHITIILFKIIAMLFINAFVYIIANICLSGSKTNKFYIKYINIFKRVVIERLIKNFYNNVEYFPNKELPERIYKESEHELHYDNYYSDDYIEAKIDNNDIQMGEVLVQKEETKTDSEGNKTTTYETLFHGVFAKLYIEKSINSELRIELNNLFNFNKNKLEMDSRRV